MLKIAKSLLFVEKVWHFQRLPNNIKRTKTKVQVQQELLWIIISGYKHEKNKQKKNKKKTGSSSQYVNCISDFAFLPVNCFQSFSCAKKKWHVNCISDFAFLSVNCFQSFSCAKKKKKKKRDMKATNVLKLYMYTNCNFSWSFIKNNNDVSTHAWPRLILHGP